MRLVPTTADLQAARSFYAEELRFTANVSSPALRAAFAAVPRERFVGPGPWRVKSAMTADEFWTTEDDDPRHVYHDVLIALDKTRGYYNGQPSFWAFLLDKLALARDENIVHLGCGTGYYAAILAEMTGPGGRVLGIDLHEGLGAKARIALQPWSHVTVEIADGSKLSIGPTDVIVASAGATKLLPAWLDALRAGGRLLLPMTSVQGPGGMLLVTRRDQTCYAARFLSPAAFVPFEGARDPDTNQRLTDALRKDRGVAVRSLRRDPHNEDESCWLHGDKWCLSNRELA